MTEKEFVLAIQDYYGQYTSKIMLQEIKRWLDNCRLDLELLWHELIGDFSSQYGKVPDIAVLNNIVQGSERLKRSKHIYEDENGEVWSHGQFVGHYDGGHYLPFYGMGVPKGVRQMDHTTPEKFIEFVQECEDGKYLPGPTGLLDREEEEDILKIDARKDTNE